jgi:TetR/AcrR family transcriptional repressor of nem operon
MGRRALVQRDIALDRVMRHFWSNGYQASSIDDLLKASGLHRASFYRAFGAKENAFVLALQSYMNRVAQQHVFPSLMKGRSPRKRLFEFLDLRLDDALSGLGTAGRERPGCLVVNTATELAAHDPKIRSLVAAGLDAIREAIARLVREAVQAGEAHADLDTGFAANQIFTLLQGANVMARTGADAAALRTLLHRAAEASLGPRPWPVH